MPRFELFQVESVEQHTVVDLKGFSPSYDDACVSCGEPVGLQGSELYEYIVVLDNHDDYWFTCAGCASPVLNPDF